MITHPQQPHLPRSRSVVAESNIKLNTEVYFLDKVTTGGDKKCLQAAIELNLACLRPVDSGYPTHQSPKRGRIAPERVLCVPLAERGLMNQTIDSLPILPPPLETPSPVSTKTCLLSRLLQVAKCIVSRNDGALDCLQSVEDVKVVR